MDGSAGNESARALAAASGAAIGWATAGFFGLCAVVAGVTLLPRAAYLRLERGAGHVGFDFSPEAEPAGAAIASKMAGVQGGLPDTYGLKPEELAELLTLWRRTYSRP